MIAYNFKKVNNQDLTYAIVGNIAIDFGYITRKERSDFRQFLQSHNFIKKVDGCINFEIVYPFVYRTVKSNKTDDALMTVHLFKQGVYINYDFVEVEFLEVE